MSYPMSQVGWLVGWVVGWLVGWFVRKISISEFPKQKSFSIFLTPDDVPKKRSVLARLEGKSPEIWSHGVVSVCVCFWGGFSVS